MSITFEVEKETKGAIRYREVSEDPVIGTLYIRKAHLKDLGLTGKENVIVEITKEEK
ncbi:hypothetical protein OBO34_21165 [Clostridiales Family XIII bacterium ASD5510]|uniref:Uncharacterized protein n=1 Tax=Hominibacterium faecale TaxID=2839743 RepID=A0A9J6QZD7_9FIRM|nr:hypothetical protein [Hominibacterium faecale]MCU7380828.1 hypothetical protein [Hominibacterium faecale]